MNRYKTALNALRFSKSDLRMFLNLFRMNLRDRYLGAGLGSLWVVLTPLLLMLVYTFVFGFVFKAKVPGAETSLAYVIWLISGLAIWFGMNEGIMAATHSMVGNAGLIKNLSFRTDLLPLAAASTGIIPILVGTGLLLLLMLLSGRSPSIHVMLLVLVVPLALGLSAAIGRFTSIINVFSRDFGHGLPTLLLMVMFFTPIFYSIEALPGAVRQLTFLNPIYHIVEGYRRVLVEGKAPDWIGLGYVFLLVVVLNMAGLLLHARLKSHCVSRL